MNIIHLTIGFHVGVGKRLSSFCALCGAEILTNCDDNVLKVLTKPRFQSMMP